MCVWVCVSVRDASTAHTKNVKLYVGWQVEVAAPAPATPTAPSPSHRNALRPVELSGRVRVAQQFAYKKGC